MTVHAFIIELDQLDYRSIPKKKTKIVKLYVQNFNGELSCCDITYSGIVLSREGDIQNFE